MTDFSTAMQLTPTGDRRWTATLPSDWGQGRTMFGGLLAALAARVAVQVVGVERPLRTLDVAFIAPILPGLAELELEVLGEGKAVTQLVVSIRSSGELGCRVHVVAGAARVSALRLDTAPAELVEGDPASQGVDFPYLPGVMPPFCQHIEYRWCGKDFPYSGGGPESARLSGWARHRSAAQGLEATIALLDCWPPVILPMASGNAPASTVRWAIHLAGLSDPPEPELADAGLINAGLINGGLINDESAERDSGEQWFWYEAQAVQCADGYATGYASMYANGRLVAWSEQLIVVYDRPAEVAPAPAGVSESTDNSVIEDVVSLGDPAGIAEPATSA